MKVQWRSDQLCRYCLSVSPTYALLAWTIGVAVQARAITSIPEHMRNCPLTADELCQLSMIAATLPYMPVFQRSVSESPWLSLRKQFSGRLEQVVEEKEEEADGGVKLWKEVWRAAVTLEAGWKLRGGFFVWYS